MRVYLILYTKRGYKAINYDRRPIRLIREENINGQFFRKVRMT